MIVTLANFDVARGVVVTDSAGTTVFGLVPARSDAAVQVPAGAFKVRSLNDDGTTFSETAFDTATTLAVLVRGDGVPSDLGLAATVGESAPSVHVVNPTQGMEFVLLSAGFICAAIVFRFILGRW